MSTDKNWPDTMIYIEGSGALESITPVKEGAKDGDGHTGLSLKISATIRTRNAVLMMGSVRTEKQWNEFLWDAKKGSKRVFGINGITSKQQFGKSGGCYFTGLDHKDVEAQMKKITLSPDNVPDCWDATFSVYIRDPSEELLYEALINQKSTIDFKFIQKQEEIASTDDDEGDDD